MVDAVKRIREVEQYQNSNFLVVHSFQYGIRSMNIESFSRVYSVALCNYRRTLLYLSHFVIKKAVALCKKLEMDGRGQVNPITRIIIDNNNNNNNNNNHNNNDNCLLSLLWRMFYDDDYLYKGHSQNQATTITQNHLW